MTRYSIPTFAALAIAGFSVSALAQAPTSPPGFNLSGTLHDARGAHTANLLKDGRVLVAGGGQGPDNIDGFFIVPGAELFDPVSGSFTPAGTFARQYHTGTLLPSGKVLLAGGEQLFSIATTESELYDPITGQFQPTGSLVVARESHTATLLPDGRVLMGGGFRSQDNEGGNWVSLSDAEIYDPVTGTFSLTGSLNDPRYGHSATLLPSGKVLITGGYSTQRGDSLASAELYDPATGVFTRTGSMSVARSGVATLLLDGHVLITGDEKNPELYDPATGSFALTGNTLVRRQWHTASLLRDGTVLLVGGENAAGVAEIQSEIYDPVKRTFTAGPNLNFPRVYHTATSLPDGRVAIIGGAGLDGGLGLNFFNSAEIYGPIVGSISASANPCVMSSALWLAHCTTYLAWSTSGISNAQVWVRVGNAPETNFADIQSCGGTDCPAPWIEANTVYTFTLYNCDAANCTVTGHANARAIAAVQVRGIYGSGSIAASPNPCALSGTHCTTYLTWSTSGISNAQVWVRIGLGPETEFASGQSCGGTDCPAPWIDGNGDLYIFSLYNCDGANCTYTSPLNGREVANVQVTGTP